MTIINETDIKLSLQASQQQILNKIAQWISEGSGWTIQSIENHYINIVNYNPLKGSSYIKLPQELKNRGLINLQNEDNECFRWCHIRHLNPQRLKNPQRIKKTDKQYIEKLDYSGIEFPVTVKQINKIEKQNNICINLFGYEEKQIFPIYISKEKFTDHMELLLITEGENKHYVLIKDFNKFMFNQTKHEHRKHFCMHCLQCNNQPNNVAAYFLDAVQEYGGCPVDLVTDLGTENGIMAAIQSFFRDDPDSHRYVPSPRNQRIEAWWGFFKKSNATWWINLFKDMVEGRVVDLTSELEMECLWFCFSRLLQKMLDEVKEHWNTHRIRRSRHDTVSGRPDSLFYLPELHGISEQFLY